MAIKKSKRSCSFTDLKKEVIDTALCTHCGLCVDACPVNAIGISGHLEGRLPILVGDCSECSICYHICSGNEVDFKALSNLTVFEGSGRSNYLGRYRNLYLGYAASDTVRRSASSGGIITALLLHLLNRGEIDGAVVVASVPDKPWSFQTKIAETPDEIRQSVGSKYVVTPVNLGVDKITEYNGRLAFVGLPCQIHALRKIEKRYPRKLRSIKYIIGLYCGDTLSFDATASLLARFGIKDYNQIESLGYRDGAWPGNFSVQLKNGTRYSISKFTFNYLSFFYSVGRCKFCIDLTAEFADISVGDGWKYEGTKPSPGWSVVISRTPKGQKLIQSARKNDAIYLEEISEQDAVAMHSHGLNNKKEGAFIRMEYQQKMGLPIPDYHLEPPRVSFIRKTYEKFVLAFLRLCLLNISKKIINKVPIFLLERLLYLVRKLWMKLTRSKIKESNDLFVSPQAKILDRMRP